MFNFFNKNTIHKTSTQTNLFDIRRFADFLAIFFSALLSLELVSANAINKVSFTVLMVTSIIEFSFLLPIMIQERYWRNVSAYEAVRFFKNSLIFSVLFLVLDRLYSGSFTHFDWIFVNFLTSFCSLCGMRLARRMLFEVEFKRLNVLKGRPTLIYGTGSAAQSLALRFARDTSLGIRLVGYVSESAAQVGTVDHGVPIIGTISDIPRLLSSYSIQQLILARPILDGAQLKTILQEAYALNVQTRVLTECGLTGNEVSSDLFREINLQDLLQRPRVEVNLGSTEQIILGQTVLVSGAGGSIGSELIRQIAKMKPSRILALDHSEYNLYEIESEMKRAGYPGLMIPILSDLKEPKLINRILEEYRPACVFHAAAYKHVHLVETNANASILNNILTLKNLLNASLSNHVDYFVLISSDKAVNPKGIMGCTKRAAELMVSQAAEQSGMRYCSVRFGNVLGSSGSFIPLMKKQILEGGPVTITHPEMERYFMLIPEAVSLVLKAASISAPGDINVLRMGESIKILDIVKSLIALLGKTENAVPIIYTGIRPGEKLREELYLRGDELTTQHPDILVLPHGARGVQLSDHEKIKVGLLIDEVISMAKNDDPNARVLLRSIVELSNQEPVSQDRNEVQVEKFKTNSNLVA